MQYGSLWCGACGKLVTNGLTQIKQHNKGAGHQQAVQKWYKSGESGE